MPTYDKETNTYVLSKIDKFRLFEIKHKSIEYIAVFSNFLMPFAASIFSIGWFAYVIGFLYWWLLRFDNTVCVVVYTSLHWMVGIVLGVLGEAPPIIWIAYFPLLINAVYYMVCEALYKQECKKESTPLEILYKQHKIK